MSYTAKIIKKEEINGVIVIDVEFSNGNKTLIEQVKPQDKQGFQYWVKSRLTSLDTLEELQNEDNLNKQVDLSSPTPADNRTETEKTRDAWLVKYGIWMKIKTNLIDTGILTGDETMVKNYLADVRSGFKPTYINFI